MVDFERVVDHPAHDFYDSAISSEPAVFALSDGDSEISTEIDDGVFFTNGVFVTAPGDEQLLAHGSDVSTVLGKDCFCFYNGVVRSNKKLTRIEKKR